MCNQGAFLLFKNKDFDKIIYMKGINNKNLSYNRVDWEKEIGSETSFWDKWCATKGLEWKDRFKMKTNPNTKLQDFLLPYINKNYEKTTILDVGAGPLTEINKKYDFSKIEITPVDPLAREYQKILEKHKIKPIIETELGYGERLTEQFKENTFDITYSRNAIDHSHNPLKFIEEMIKVTKREHFIFIRVFENEGTHQKWSGFHKWNFFLKKPWLFSKKYDLWLKSKKSKRINITKKFKEIVDVVKIRKDDRQITLVLKKK